MKLEDFQNDYWRRVATKKGRPTRTPAADDAPRWAPMPGQARGDAKDPLTRILEAGFDPDRFEHDAEYQGRPDIQALAAKYVPLALERDRAAQTADMVATSKYVAEHAAEMQAQLDRSEIKAQMARLQTQLDALPAADDEEPEDDALAADEASAALPDTEEE